MHPGAASPAGPGLGGDEAPPPDLVELGLLRGAYGLQGWTHVQPHSGDAQVLRSARHWWLFGPRTDDAPGLDLKKCRGTVEISTVRAQGAGLVAKWPGCEDPEAAQAMKGWRIAVSRAQFPRLPKGQFYWVDLIGTQVVNRSGLVLGTVLGLRNYGAHDLLEVEHAGAATPVLIPMVAAYLDGIDLPEGRIRVDWDAAW